MKFLAHIFFHVHELLLKGVIEKLHNKESTMKFINELRMWSEKLYCNSHYYFYVIIILLALYSQLYSLATEQFSFHFLYAEYKQQQQRVTQLFCCCSTSGVLLYIQIFNTNSFFSHRIYEECVCVCLKVNQRFQVDLVCCRDHCVILLWHSCCSSSSTLPPYAKYRRGSFIN